MKTLQIFRQVCRKGNRNFIGYPNGGPALNGGIVNVFHSKSGGDTSVSHKLEVAYPDDGHPHSPCNKFEMKCGPIPFTSTTAPVSSGGDWCGPCLMDLQPVPQGSFKEGYKKFHRQRLIMLAVGATSLTISILTLYNMDLLVRRN
ncbi:uncharacterized protein LOC103519521 isoform X2 [Diaphorina citri]|uniref:Uncharacterized protein LOC103519521 isoform X1 n=1 Tax=Diaphorina citri TaxID=121845 RepID=A0A1S3DJ64_DIACI|nr:uncharacterized protein LOC103519521 isoform X1 [Diaphorina citri]XP_008482831.1 uncharacterized protein LOC103519521 isoform X2 [Diaphorina citri]KAI5739216.1 hypothetical protein M8J77_016479 [Diaphorina citri]